MNKRTWLIASSAAVMMVLGGCASTLAPKSIVATAAATPQLSTLSRLIQDAGLAETLNGPGPFTIFAPTDDAFKAVPATTLQALTGDKDRLRAVLTYHVLPTLAMSADVKNGPAKTVQGSNVALSKSGTFVTIEEAVVTTPDVRAANGVVHVIDRVLIPPAK
jgi:uncharacterized surface protein with fasciclin (FAS1) repeats